MKIIADENIPFVEQVFNKIGSVTTLPGRSISHINLKKADILLVRSITSVNAQLLNNTPIKFVASATSGINHVDQQYLKHSNITFAHAPGSNAISVAQYVVAGICHWSLLNHKPLEELSIGIIGYGNVGTQLRILCQKLGISCILNDPPLTATGQRGYSSLEKALTCDIVSVHVPLTVDGKYPTNHLLNQENVYPLKPDGLFINAARGGVVDESALLSHQSKYPKFSIILDTWENEPEIDKNLLEKTLIATPHIAGYSFDGKLRGTQMIYQACCEFLGQKHPWSTIDLNLPDQQPSNLSQAKHPDIRLSILAAYDIIRDDKCLRLMLSQKKLSTAEYFDKLRKNYPIRREWI